MQPVVNEQYRIGQEVEREGKLWLVVRIVESDTALVINDANEEFITKESYVMLKADDGEIDFVVLLHEDVPFTTDPTRKIPSLPSLWRKHASK